MVKLTLANGATVEFAGTNGNNFIVPNKVEMDASVFTDENLKSGTVTMDDGTIYEFADLRFTQQQKQKDGNYYVCFHEITDTEKLDEMKDLLVDVASVQVSNGDIAIDDVPLTLADEVKCKIDDSKRLDK